MFSLKFSEQFFSSFNKLRDKQAKVQIWKKVNELEFRAPIGKKLTGNPYWSIHVNRFRIIYILEGNEIKICELLERKYSYKGLS